MQVCPECSKQYSSAGSLQSHLEIHLCTPAAQFHCYYCPKILRGPIARYYHVSSVHKDYFHDYKSRYPQDPADAEMRKKVKEYYLEITGDTSNPNLSLPTADTTVESLDDSTQASTTINSSTFDDEVPAMSNTPSDTPNKAPRLRKVSQKLACPSPDCGKDDFVTKRGLKQHMKFRHTEIFEESSPIGYIESSLENLGLSTVPATPEAAEEDQADQEVPQTARSQRKRKRQARNDDDIAAGNPPRRTRRRKKAISTLATGTLSLIQPLPDSDSPLTYTCVCGMYFLDETDLMIHLQAYHTETSDRECPICFFVLRSSNEYALYVHKRAHNFDASHPFGCNHPEDCHKKFKTAGEMARHTHNVQVPELQGLLEAPQQNDQQESEQQEMNSANTLEGIQLHETEEEPYELMAHHRVQVMFEDHSGPEPSWTTIETTHKTEVQLPITTEQTQLMETDETEQEYQEQLAAVPDTALDPSESEITSDLPDHPETEAVEDNTQQVDEEMYDPDRVIKRSPSIIWLDAISSVKCANCLLPTEQANHQECLSTAPPSLPIADEWRLWIRG